MVNVSRDHPNWGKRKPKGQQVYFTFLLPRDAYNELREIARDNDRSMSAEVRRLIMDGIAWRKQKGKKP